MKSILEIITQIKNGLASSNSPLASFTNYSNIYALLRSISSVINEQYIELNNYYRNSYLYTSVGEDLDYRALDYGIFRNEPNYATGFVYATSNSSITILEGTILSLANSSEQYRTEGIHDVNSSGVFIPITSISSSLTANIPSNTYLTSGLYPTVKFIVGSSVSLNGELTGGLYGALPSENDDSFKSRIVSHLSNITKGNIDSVINVLNSINIPKFFIKESYPIPGYFTIYVDIEDQSLIESIEEQVIFVKPLGTSFQILPILNSFIDLRFSVSVTSLSLIESISESIKNTCFNYFNNLDLGQELYPINLSVLCANIPGIVDIRIVDPTDSKVVIPFNTYFKLRNVYINFNGG